MKTLEEFKAFSLARLMPELQKLENQRRHIVRKLVITAAIIAGLCLLIIALFWGRVQNPLVIIMVPGIIGLIAWIGAYQYLTRDFVRIFKERVIRRIVAYFDRNLIYEPYGYISEIQFIASGLFKQQPDRYKGDDLVRGTLGQTAIEFSEIHAEYKTETTDGKGNRQRRWHPIFHGLFVIADFNKHFQGRTVVLPDTAERMFGSLGKMLQSWNFTRDELVKLEDPEFEKNFAVYSTDQIEARYILSPNLMRRIVEFKKRTGRAVHISFVLSHIYVAISYNKRLFEPRIFRTLIDFEPVKKYYEDLSLATGLVNDLNLNRRIWSKQ